MGRRAALDGAALVEGRLEVHQAVVEPVHRREVDDAEARAVDVVVHDVALVVLDDLRQGPGEDGLLLGVDVGVDQERLEAHLDHGDERARAKVRAERRPGVDDLVRQVGDALDHDLAGDEARRLAVGHGLALLRHLARAARARLLEHALAAVVHEVPDELGQVVLVVHRVLRVHARDPAEEQRLEAEAVAEEPLGRERPFRDDERVHHFALVPVLLGLLPRVVHAVAVALVAQVRPEGVRVVVRLVRLVDELEHAVRVLVGDVVELPAQAHPRAHEEGEAHEAHHDGLQPGDASRLRGRRHPGTEGGLAATVTLTWIVYDRAF